MTPRERIYMRHTGAATLVDEEYLIWINAALRHARHQRDLFKKNGQVADEARFLEYLRLHYPKKESQA